MKINEIIKKLKETNSRLNKISILEDNKNNEFLKEILFYTYNPFYNYYVKKYKKQKLSNNGYMRHNEMIGLLDELKTRKTTGNAAIKLVENFLKNTKEEQFYILPLILNRNLKCGISTSTINKVFPDLIPEFKVALASGEGSVKNIKFPAICQLKGDGRRTLVFYSKGKVKYFTRSGKRDLKLNYPELDNEFINLTWSEDYADFDWVFDCEVIMVNNDGTLIDRKISNGKLNKLKLNKKDQNKIRFLIWDSFPKLSFDIKYDNTTYGERFKYLERLFEIHNKLKYLQLIPSQIVESLKEAKNISSKYILEGFEGAMLKNINAPYEGKRTNNQIKIKAEREADLVVVDWKEGTGIMKGYLGALICESKDSKLSVNIGTGFSHEQRGFTIIDTDNMITAPVSTEFNKKEIIGKIITVKYNELITCKGKIATNSLFLPRFVEIRNDKNEADTLKKIKEEN